MGAEDNIFVDGTIGLGWKKTVYGDANRAMYTYNPSIEKFDDGSVGLCGGEALLITITLPFCFWRTT